MLQTTVSAVVHRRICTVSLVPSPEALPLTQPPESRIVDFTLDAHRCTKDWTRAAFVLKPYHYVAMKTCRCWQALRSQQRYRQQSIRTFHHRPFAPDDLVILRQKLDRTASPILSKPLKAGDNISTHRGTIQHDDIIGKYARDVVKTRTTRSTSEGIEYRIHPVTLEDYARLSKRLVTPIYPADANLIVSLLDLHPDAYPAGEDTAIKTEILEAGTGHGALTLYLSRAIHAANISLRPTNGRNEEYEDPDLELWKSQRKAIVHTIDVSSKYSARARKVVEGFRNGIYRHNVDFHVGDVGEWLSGQLSARGGGPFLTHAVLDMPNADSHFANVAAALVTDGTLVAFNPSISQIMSCATQVKDHKIPLELERVVELGVNGGSGGREWDLRFVRPRTKQAVTSEATDESMQTLDGGEQGTAMDMDGTEEAGASEVAGNAERQQGDADKWYTICRPRVGERIIGGGFLGVWKKQRDMNSAGGSSITPGEGAA